MASSHAPSGKMLPNFLTMSFDMVTVSVGEADTAVNIPVYRDQLSAVSPYFRGAFEGSFKEATDRNLPLTDVSEQTFRMFLQWMYVQISSQPGGASKPAPDALVDKPTTKSEDKIRTIPAIDEEGYYDEDFPNGGKMYNSNWKDLEPENNYQLMVTSFLRLYVFADKYDVPQLREDILTALVTHWHI
ncbi:hypothetical protein ACET3X_008547 [Alternaria dauci]|uniref:BTB domain-containing protein n=1 Tax=Alternaria dauci TaxID=48095 RepID=A0ABR3UC55_9PLEO